MLQRWSIASVLFEDKCLNLLEQPYYNEPYDYNTHCCDGMFLQKLSEHFEFFPVGEVLIYHNFLPISTFQKT